MKNRINRPYAIATKIFIVFFLFQITLAGAEAADKCSSVEKDVSVESTLATAALFAKEENRQGSIRYESKALMNKAEAGAQNAEKPEGFCPAGCELNNEPVVIFKAIPHKFLTSYSDYDMCQKLLEQTEKTPFNYNKQFDSITDVENWFSNFSRGKGTDGKDLDKKCGGDCSPQYEFFITNNGANLTLNADVVCGHARDKSDDKYNLFYSYRWTCQSK